MTRCGIWIILASACAVLTSTAWADQSASEAGSHFLRGEEHRKAGRLDDAIDEYLRALELKPGSSLSKDRLVAVQAEAIAGLETELEETCRKAHILPPEATVASVAPQDADPPSDVRDQLIRAQDASITALKRQIGEIKLAHPDVFGPAVTFRVVRRGSYDPIGVAKARLRSIANARLTDVQKGALRTALRIPTTLDTQIANLSYTGAPKVLQLTLRTTGGGHIIRAQPIISDNCAGKLNMGAICRLHTVLTGHQYSDSLLIPSQPSLYVLAVGTIQLKNATFDDHGNRWGY